MLRRWIVLSMLFCAGCASRPPVSQLAPSSQELPQFPEFQQRLPINVAVEGESREPRVQLTERRQLPPLTDEERKALGLDRDPKEELLSAYRPARGYKDGVDPESGLPVVGRSDPTLPAGADRLPIARGTGIGDRGATEVGILIPDPSSGAGVLDTGTGRAGIGDREAISVGYNEATRNAVRAAKYVE